MISKAKQVIVMRTDLNMRKGKMIAQGAHASMKVLLDMLNITVDAETNTIDMPKGVTDEGLSEWLSGKFTKVCCQIDSEQAMFDMYEAAKSAGIPCSLILDAGLTEFKEPTHTCIAIGPAMREDVDRITGHLKLL